MEEGTEPSLESLDDAIVPVLWALRDQPPGVGGEEVVLVAEVEPLRVPLGVVGRQPKWGCTLVAPPCGPPSRLG